MDIFKARDQQEFLLTAHKWYRTKCGVESDTIWGGQEYRYHSEKYVHWLYRLGRDYQLLKLGYTQFKDILQNPSVYGIMNRRYEKPKQEIISPYWSISSYRVSKKFIWRGQKKKDKVDNWLVVSGIAKTRKKESSHWGGHSKKNFKMANKRKHRTFERQMLSALRWDHLHSRTWKEMEDWWAWD